MWLLGRSNRFLRELTRGQKELEIDADAGSLQVAAKHFAGKDIIAALVWANGDQSIHWAAAHPSLARKLPHYGKYGYLVFEGQAPENCMKGQWPAGDSRLTVWLSDDWPRIEMPPKAPLTALLA